MSHSILKLDADEERLVIYCYPNTGSGPRLFLYKITRTVWCQEDKFNLSVYGPGCNEMLDGSHAFVFAPNQELIDGVFEHKVVEPLLDYLLEELDHPLINAIINKYLAEQRGQEVATWKA